MSKKLNLILAIILIAISLPAFVSSSDREDSVAGSRFLPRDQHNWRSVAAGAGGGLFVYWASRDTTAAAGFAALFGWLAYELQFGKTLAGAIRYIRFMGNKVNQHPLLRYTEEPNTISSREAFLLSQWQKSVGVAEELHNRIAQVPGLALDDIFRVDGDSLKRAIERIDDDLKRYEALRPVNEYNNTRFGRLRERIFRAGGNKYGSDTLLPTRAEDGINHISEFVPSPAGVIRLIQSFGSTSTSAYSK